MVNQSMIEGIGGKLDAIQPHGNLDDGILKPDVQNGGEEALSAPGTTSENELVALDFNDGTDNSTSGGTENSELDLIQKQYDYALESFLFYQQQIAETQKEIRECERKIKEFSDNQETAQRYQSKLEGLNSTLGGFMQGAANCEAKMQELMAKFNEGLAEMVNINATALSAESLTYSAPKAGKVQAQGTSMKGAPSFSGSSYKGAALPKDVANALDRKLGSGFSAKCESVAGYLGCNVNDLLAMMYSESGLQTTARNKSSNAIGLIQFMPSTLRANGYSTEQVASMSAIQQLDVVADIFMKAKKMAGYGANEKISGGTLYAINWLPAYAKNDTIATRGGKYYSSGLDMNKDGSVTKADLEQRLQKKYNEMLNNI